MCYSAQIWADFRKYERFGGTLDIKGYMALAGWTRAKGTWIKTVPKAMRHSVLAMGSLAPELVDLAAAEREGIAVLAADIDAQSARLDEANAKLAMKRPKKNRGD